MKMVLLKRVFVFALCFVLCALYMPQLSWAQKIPIKGDVIDMVAGDIDTIPTDDLTRVSVTNPDVADISDAESNGISILGKKGGETLLFLWDSNGKRKIKVRVVNQDLITVKESVKKILEGANIAGISLEVDYDIGKVLLSGELTKDDLNRMNDILEPYSDNLMNLVKEEKSDELVEIDMQIVEINTTLDKELGVSWGPTALNYNETLPSFNGKPGDFFKIGNFARTTSLEATVNALLTEGKARLISKPRLVVESGKQASFLVGGQIPINSTTTSASGGTQTENTTYTQYGVSMTVTPTIRDGKIEVVLNVDIQDVDNSSLSSPGNVAFITRTASTNLLMDNKQTIALAGLIKYQDSVTLNEVPFVSKIPILGALFRNRSEPSDASTEMVLIIRPTVLTNKKFENRELVMPTPQEREAWKEIDAKYEHEDLPAWPLVKTAPPEKKIIVKPVVTTTAPVIPVARAIVQDPLPPLPQEVPPPPPAVNTVTEVVPQPVQREIVPPAPVIQQAPVPVVPPPVQREIIPPPAPVVQEVPQAPVMPAVVQKTVPVVAEVSPMPAAKTTSIDQPGAIPAMTTYARMVHDKISQVISYPSQGMTGIVRLKLRIRRDGNLSSVVVVGSSGNRTLDKYAMQAAKKAAPYDAFTNGMDSNNMVFLIPIVYDKSTSDSQASAEKASAS